MCSMIDSGEKGYKLPEQILFNSLVLYLTLCWQMILIKNHTLFLLKTWNDVERLVVCCSRDCRDCRYKG